MNISTTDIYVISGILGLLMGLIITIIISPDWFGYKLFKKIAGT